MEENKERMRERHRESE